MIIVDTALEQREAADDPVRVAIVGAGYMGRGMVRTITTAMPGMAVALLTNRTVATAERTWDDLGVQAAGVTSQAELTAAMERGTPAFSDDPMLACRTSGIDVVVEATGEVEFGAHVAVEAIAHGKHLVLMNAELDAVVGPELKARADAAGVVVSNVDGDQPGVIMNLLRWVRTIGYRPLLAGNLKGLQDHYRTPETQQGFADRVNQGVKMITSFADGTKISMEMAVVANATGFGVLTRGMHGHEADHVTEAPQKFDVDELLAAGGAVDFLLGAEPGPGVFVLGYNTDPVQAQYASYLKMGEGPLYTFYVPYHLPHLEAPLTCARAALFGDAAITPRGGPVAEVLTAAKTDLAAGTTLDGIGGFHVYGTIDDVEVARRDDLLPMSLSEGCVLRRDVRRDQVLTRADVTIPSGRLVDELRAAQDERFHDN